MLKLIISLLLGSVALLGLGIFCENHFLFRSFPEKKKLSVSELLFSGFWLQAFVGLILHFFIPISQQVSLLVWATGTLLFIRYRKLLRARFSSAEGALFFALILGVSALATASYFNIDTGYYHLPTISLIESFPLLPGIANVFGPYGHNTTWFVTEALFNLPFLGISSVFSVNALLSIAFLFFLKDLFLERSIYPTLFASIVLLCFNHFGLGLGGLTPDFPNTVLSCVAWGYFLRILSSPSENQSYLFSQTLCWVTLAIATKLSALSLLIPFAFSAWVIRDSITIKKYRWVLIGNLLFASIWALRGVMTSGCLLFPQTVSCLETLPWALPLQEVTRWYADIKKHLCGVALSGSIFSNPNCLRQWWLHFKNEPVWRTVLVLSLFSFSWLLFDLKRIKNKPMSPHRSSIFFQALFPLFLATCLWFLSAPNLRFGLWIVFAWLGLIFGGAFEKRTIQLNTKPLHFYFLLLVAFGLTFRSAVLTRPFEINWSHWPVLPDRKTTAFRSKNGITVSIPQNDFRCWELSPPCTPEPTEFKIGTFLGNRIWFGPQSPQGQ